MLASTSALTEFGKASRSSGHARRDRLARRRNCAGDSPPYVMAVPKYWIAVLSGSQRAALSTFH